MCFCILETLDSEIRKPYFQSFVETAVHHVRMCAVSTAVQSKKAVTVTRYLQS